MKSQDRINKGSAKKIFKCLIKWPTLNKVQMQLGIISSSILLVKCAFLKSVVKFLKIIKLIMIIFEMVFYGQNLLVLIISTFKDVDYWNVN